jgi:cytoskeleton protein RodZ
MASVGAYLRELRTRRGVSLEEIARLTRVAPRYLEALEADASENLPAPVFIRGFIRAYCQALGESPKDALAIYEGHDVHVVVSAVRPGSDIRSTATGPRTRGAVLVSFALLEVLGLALFTVALVIQPRSRGERPTGEARPAPPPSVITPDETRSPSSAPASAPASPAPVAPAPPPATSRPSAAVSVPTPAPPPAAPSPAARPATLPNFDTLGGAVTPPYRLVARISESSWIRVRTEDGRTSEETVAAGEVREWVSDRPFVLTIGNAGGVALELNGRALPSLGPRGVVIPRLVLPPDPR